MDKLADARLRAKAKRFRDSIPRNMARKIPDEILDSIKDEEIDRFFFWLDSLGVIRSTERNHWEVKK